MKLIQTTFEDELDAFNSHPSIERIRRTANNNERFSFQPVPEDLVREIILNLQSHFCRRHSC